MATTVVGLFDFEPQAQMAVQNLIDGGFDRAQISLVTLDPGGQYQQTAVVPNDEAVTSAGVTGITSGLLMGGLVGLLIGTATVAAGPVGLLAVGPLAGLITGAGLGAATGGIIGGLVGLGIPENTAEVYAEGIRRGSILVTVGVSAADQQSAEAILLRAGAADIQERAAFYRSGGWKSFDPKAPVYTTEEVRAEQERLEQQRLAADPLGTAPPAIQVGVVRPTMDDETFFRNHFSANFPAVAGEFDTFRPAYEFGYELAGDTDLSRDNWSLVEPRAQTLWNSVNPGTWDRFENAVRAGWSRAQVPPPPRAQVL